MPRKRYDNFSDGINNTDSAIHIGSRQLSDGLNVMSDERGAVQERLGCEQYGNTMGSTTGIMGLHGYVKYTTGVVYPLAVYNTDVYLYSSGTWTAQSQTLTANKKAAFVDAFDKVYFTNGTNNVMHFDGSTWTALASFPKGTMWAFHENRLITAGVSGSEDTLFYSDLGTHTWTITSYITFEEKITGLLSRDIYLYIFTEKAVYRFARFIDYEGTTQGPDRLEKLPANTGTIAPRSVMSVGQCMYFVHPSGVFCSDGYSRILVSADVEGMWADMDKDTMLNAASAFYDNKAFIAMQEDGESYNNAVLVFDIKKIHQTTTGEFVPAAWLYKYNGIYPAVFAVIPETTGETRLYCGDQSTGKVYRLETGTNDNSSAIQSYATKPVLHDEDPSSRKRLQVVQLTFADLGDKVIDIGVANDLYGDFSEKRLSLDANEPTRGDSLDRNDFVRGEKVVDTQYVTPHLRGNYFFVKMKNYNTDESWKVRQIACKYRRSGRYQDRD